MTTVLESREPTDEIDQFILQENDRLERVKLRRRQYQKTKLGQLSLRPSPAFNNPNYVDMPIISENEEIKSLESILV